MKENILIAPEGYKYTNGDAYGRTIELGCNDKVENWWLITEEEYKALMEAEDEQQRTN